jgi:hypothetical protein
MLVNNVVELLLTHNVNDFKRFRPHIKIISLIA